MKTIVLVEPDLARAEAFGRALQAAGASVASLPDGEKALAKARAARPDLFVVASALPDMSGFSFCNRLRRAPGLADVPIVLVPGAQDAAATEAHRASKTPANDYLAPGADPSELVRRAASLVSLGWEEAPSGSGSPEELSTEDLLDIVDDATRAPPPLAAPAGPPPLRLSAGQATARPRIADPFADAAPEPRASLGGSPEEKLAFFRDRVKAKDELLARAKQAFGQAQEALQSLDQELAGARTSSAQLAEAKRSLEAQLAQASQRVQALEKELEEAQGAKAESVERAQSLSELTNEALRERERAEQDWAARLAEADQRLRLLQEEAEHLGQENERLSGELEQRGKAAAELEASLADERGRFAETNEKLSEAKIEVAALQGELEASRQEIDAERARSGSVAADLDAERARAEAEAARLVELEGALEGARAIAAELTGELESLRGKLPELEKARDDALGRAKELEERLAALEAKAKVDLEASEGERHGAEQRLAEASSELFETKGQLDALQESDREWQARAAQLEGRIVQLEADLSSREEETAGLRAELERARSGREELQDDLASQIAALSQQLHERDARVASLTQQLEQAPAPKPAAAASDKELASLRVRLSDVSAELKALRAKQAASAPAGKADPAVRKLQADLEAQRGQNELLRRELDRLRAQLGDDTTIEIDLAK